MCMKFLRILCLDFIYLFIFDFIFFKFFWVVHEELGHFPPFVVFNCVFHCLGDAVFFFLLRHEVVGALSSYSRPLPPDACEKRAAQVRK